MNKFRYNLRVLLILSVVLFFSACNNEDYFLNPEKSTDTKIEYLWANGLSKSNFRLASNETFILDYERIAYWTDLNCYGGSSVELLDLTTVGGQIGTSRDIQYWNRYYLTIMPSYIEAERVYSDDLSGEEKANYEVYMHIIKVCKALETSIATDFFGDMPYSEAFTARSSNQVFFPKFDAQKDIYYAILADLKTAANGLKGLTLNSSDPHRVLATQDLIYKGDVTKWYKLANSLRLRLAMRISGADEAKAKEVIVDLASHEMIEANADNALFASIEPNTLNGTGESYNGSNRTHYDFRRYGNNYASAFFVDNMKATSDPRLSIIYTLPAEAGDYVGFSNDPRQAPTVINDDNISILDTLTFEKNTAFPGISMTASEVHFLKAEAIKKGYMSGNAETSFNAGVKTSVEFYYYLRNLNTAAAVTAPTATEVDNFIAGIGYADASALETIWTQKRIHLGRIVPFEAWSDFRRTDFPKLTKFVDAGTTYARPVRLLYNTSEESLNEGNQSAYKDVKQTDRVWWDTTAPVEID